MLKEVCPWALVLATLGSGGASLFFVFQAHKTSQAIEKEESDQSQADKLRPLKESLRMNLKWATVATRVFGVSTLACFVYHFLDARETANANDRAKAQSGVLSTKQTDLRYIIETVARAPPTESWLVVENDTSNPVRIKGENPNGKWALSMAPPTDKELQSNHITVVSGGKASYGFAGGVQVSCDNVRMAQIQPHGKYLRVSEIKMEQQQQQPTSN